MRTRMFPLYCEDCGQVLAVGEGSICCHCENRAKVELEIDQLRREKKKDSETDPVYGGWEEA